MNDNLLVGLINKLLVFMFIMFVSFSVIADEANTINLQRLADIQSLETAKNNSSSRIDKASACSVVQRFRAPDSDSQGLAWDSGTLWNSQDRFPEAERIYRLNLAGGILSSFIAPGDGPMGLAKVGNSIWNTDFLDDKIYGLNKSGGILRTIPSISGISSGLAWDGKNFWVSEWYSYKIYSIKFSNGSIIRSINAPGVNVIPYGLAWDGIDLWVSNSNGIYKLNPSTGKILVSCTNSDFRYGKAYGLTWDGKFLWGGSWISNEIIKISVPPSRYKPPVVQPPVNSSISEIMFLLLLE